jgi:threonine/homoserine efflux transporter RhtA
MIQSFAPEMTDDPRLWFTGLIDVAMIVAAIVVAVLFFEKRRVAVRAIIGLMIASILASVVQVLLNRAMFAKVDPQPVIHACVYGAIWIPYFLKSKRVRNTFVG